MTYFVRRRLRNTSITLIALAVVWAMVRLQQRTLGSPAFATGYILLCAVLFLAAYNIRKKLPFLPLGSSAAWLQWHLYVGMGSAGLFALHAGATVDEVKQQQGAAVDGRRQPPGTGADGAADRVDTERMELLHNGQAARDDRGMR